MTTTNFTNSKLNGFAHENRALVFVIQQLEYNITELRKAIERMGSDLQLLLDERTRPLEFNSVKIEARQYPAQETLPIMMPTDEGINDLAEELIKKPKYTRLKTTKELIDERIEKMGGASIMKRKHQAGLLHCYFRLSGSDRKDAGFYGRVDFQDKTIKTKSGTYKKFGVYIKTEEEYFSFMDILSGILGVDFRSRHS